MNEKNPTFWGLTRAELMGKIIIGIDNGHLHQVRSTGVNEQRKIYINIDGRHYFEDSTSKKYKLIGEN